MYALQTLDFIKVFPREDGIFAIAKYLNWSCEYDFLIQPDGTVKGRTQQGSWLELSKDTAYVIKNKLQDILKRNTIPLS